jgi:hypothetical protein
MEHWFRWGPGVGAHVSSGAAGTVSAGRGTGTTLTSRSRRRDYIGCVQSCASGAENDQCCIHLCEQQTIRREFQVASLDEAGNVTVAPQPQAGRDATERTGLSRTWRSNSAMRNVLRS